MEKESVTLVLLGKCAWILLSNLSIALEVMNQVFCNQTAQSVSQEHSHIMAHLVNHVPMEAIVLEQQQNVLFALLEINVPTKQLCQLDVILESMLLQGKLLVYNVIKDFIVQMFP